jgi:hypothetical protein
MQKRSRRSPKDPKRNEQGCSPSARTGSPSFLLRCVLAPAESESILKALRGQSLSRLETESRAHVEVRCMTDS